MPVYYNENDRFAAAWLRNLIAENLIAPGDVDERSIHDVHPIDLIGYDQCHFFAGIGGWSYALRLAGWPDGRPVWTGSCPCQPFSAAGKQRGTDDERHLWPEFYRLIHECRPAVVFGEQVASKLGREWLCRVRTDLEALAYAVGAADLCAPCVGAPHIRQRLYWVADSLSAGRSERWTEPRDGQTAGCGSDDRMAYANGGHEGDRELQRSGQHGQQPEDGCAGERLGDSAQQQQQYGRGDAGPGRRCEPSNDGGLGNAEEVGRRRRPYDEDRGRREQPLGYSSPWDGATFVPCADGKARRVEPGIFPLAHGVPNRVGTLRGAGNAIVPALAAEFIMACRP